MDFEKSNFTEMKYGEQSLFFDFDIHKHFGPEKRKTTQFPFHETLLIFLSENTGLNIYLTSDKALRNFKRHGDDFFVNIDDFISFCDSLGTKRKDRAKAFFGQHITIDSLDLTPEQKKAFIITNSDENDLLEALKKQSPESKQKLLTALKALVGEDDRIPSDVTTAEFLAVLSQVLDSGAAQVEFIKQVPNVQLRILKQHKDFLEKNLDKNEAFIQGWIDEQGGKFRKQRCLIFGVEYVDPKREGVVSGKKFDVLAEQNRQNHVLIELKSPSADIFDAKVTTNKNGGKLTEYHLSKDLSRAIPQILGYKRWYENATPEEIQAIGLASKKNISDCIIVIGQRKDDDQVWLNNFKDVKDALGIRIWTYTYLIEKLENTIVNLEENL